MSVGWNKVEKVRFLQLEKSKNGGNSPQFDRGHALGTSEHINKYYRT